MEIALTIMSVQAMLGAFDTMFYHEYKCRLAEHGPKVAGELRLHAFRDFVYGTLFLTLPFIAWCGVLTVVLALMIVTEICITIMDFNVEAVERQDIGGVADAERALHIIMAVVYGVFLAHLVPYLRAWFSEPTGFRLQTDVEWPLQVAGVFFGVGVIVSGVRDLMASRGVAFFQRDLCAWARSSNQ